jgi:hypothetical protein
LTPTQKFDILYLSNEEEMTMADALLLEVEVTESNFEYELECMIDEIGSMVANAGDISNGTAKLMENLYNELDRLKEVYYLRTGTYYKKF